jgi:hypothetical protein
MTPEFTLIQDTRHRSYAITAAEPIEGRVRFIPNLIEVEFDGQGQWTYVAITGHRVKNDGSVGRSRVSNGYWPDDSSLPAWIELLTNYDQPPAVRP